MRFVLRDHTAAEPAAKLDRPTCFVTKEVLDQKRNAAEGAGSERLLIEFVNSIRVGLNDRSDGWIDRGDCGCRRLREFLRRDMLMRDQLGKAEGIIAGVFGKAHHV